jgi:cytochrome c biogenesis factor
MSMNGHWMILADIVAIALLVFGIFLVRGGRRELVVAYLVANVGVVAVTVALEDVVVGAGLGLGLFGVLSIIRLRSEELSQREIAYYFAAISIGLLGGLSSTNHWLHMGIMAGVLVAIWIGDHSVFARTISSQDIILDAAIGDETEVARRLAEMLGDGVLSFQVKKVDLVTGTTLVRVRRAEVRGKVAS